MPKQFFRFECAFCKKELESVQNYNKDWFIVTVKRIDLATGYYRRYEVCISCIQRIGLDK